MPMSPFRKILATTALGFASIGLNSCIYSDLGRTVGSIGTEVPRLVPKATRGEELSSYCGNLYRKNGRYYVALPLAWVPERRRGYEFMPLFAPRGDHFNSFLTYNRPYTAEELQQYPTAPEYYEAVNPRIVPFPQPDANGAVGYVRAELTPVKDFDPQGAKLLGLYGVAGAAHRIAHLPRKRHVWYHYPFKPLQTVASVADVPLSIALMPLSFPVFWVQEMTMGKLAVLQPWYEYSRPTFGSPLHPEYDTGFSPPESMAGKRLILGDKRLDFPHDNAGGYILNGKEYSYEYQCSSVGDFRLAELVEFRPKSEQTRSWELFFITPNSGVAVCMPPDTDAMDYIEGKLPLIQQKDVLKRTFRIENINK